MDGQTPLLAVWAYLLFDAGVYVLLAWYLEQVRFGGARYERLFASDEP
jgi:hypothetical protein